MCLHVALSGILTAEELAQTTRYSRLHNVTVSSGQTTWLAIEAIKTAPKRKVVQHETTMCSNAAAKPFYSSHLLDSVAIAVQRYTGMALRASVERETKRALVARAA